MGTRVRDTYKEQCNICSVFHTLLVVRTHALKLSRVTATKMADLSGEDMEKLKKCFEVMGAKPKLDSPEEFQEWMLGYLAAQGKLPEKPEPTEHVG